MIKYFSDLGVNLDPFYKLLWRHVLTVEVLRKHFDLQEKNYCGACLWQFSNETRKDKDAKQAVQYLREWGENFWLETEYRVKEITTKMEKDLSDQISAGVKNQLLNVGASSKMRSILSDEEKAEVINRGQGVVSKAQVQDLSKVIDLLNNVLTDRQKHYYVLIDRLDENWVEEKIRYRLTMALLDSVKERWLPSGAI